jgi:hypothetical protein
LIKKAVQQISETRNSTLIKAKRRQAVHPHDWGFDAMIALILWLATRITSVSLSLYKSYLQITLAVLEMRATSVVGGEPFATIASLKLVDKSGHGVFAPAMPGLQEFVIKSAFMSRGTLDGFLTFKPPFASRLTSITLQDVSLDPKVLEDALRTPQFQVLEVLKILHLSEPSYEWGECDYDQLKQIMLKHLHALKELVWSGIEYMEDQDCEPFGSFHALKKLEVLRIEFSLIAGREWEPDNPTARQCQAPLAEFLPPSLRVFQLMNLKWSLVQNMYDTLVATAPRVTGLDIARAATHSLPSLTDIILTIESGDSLSDDYESDEEDYSKPPSEVFDAEATNYLRVVAGELQKLGVNFRASYGFPKQDMIARRG